KLVIVGGLDVHFFVVRPLELAGAGARIARFIPASEPRRQMRLHVPRMRDAGGRGNVLFGVFPSQCRTAVFFVKVDQFVIGARMQRVDAQEGFVIGNRTDLAAEETRAAGKLGAVVPPFLVIVIEG